MYGIIYEWALPATKTEKELLEDFKKIKKIAAEQGALSSHLYRSLDDNKFIGIQMWRSEEDYESWFNQEKFSFQAKQPEDYEKLIKKIKEVYKNKFLEEITPVI